MYLGALILAAGEGRRVGQPKALLPFGEVTALDLALDLFHIPEIRDIVVVLGAEAEKVQESSHLDHATVVLNDKWSTGMLSSFQAGLRSFDVLPDFLVVHLVDMPLVQRSTIPSLLLKALVTKTQLILPYYQQRTGHPVVWSKEISEAILKLPESSSAREVVNQYREEAELVEVDDPGVLFDVDVCEDLNRAQTIYRQMKTGKEDIDRQLFDLT